MICGKYLDKMIVDFGQIDMVCLTSRWLKLKKAPVIDNVSLQPSMYYEATIVIDKLDSL